MDVDEAAIPVTGVDALERHLDELAADPTLPTDNKLFDSVELQMTAANIPPLIPRLLPKVADLLKRYQCDPAPICSLTTKLLGPLEFTQIVELASEDAIIQALNSPAPSANLLAITILAKAAQSPSDAAILAANMKPLVTTFLTRWLDCPLVEVGERASRVLGDLLEIDSEARPTEVLHTNGATNGAAPAIRQVPGQGAMWRRIFQDREIYDLILSSCSHGPHQDTDEGLAPEQVSLAQGRLLRLLPRLSALNIAAVTKSHFPELHQEYASSEGVGGLLYFAALGMIDMQDMLMHLTLIDFFESMLSIQRITPFSAYKMDTLRTLYREATKNDDRLKNAILTLPERTIPDEADELRKFIHDVSAD
ncbi:hypothetical protein F4808DRAFT_453176 [Astrocystis sublimbata]|nr:hypothetical protein F4808DRAFT_453176 [Astrocystis sublimbata]